MGTQKEKICLGSTGWSHAEFIPPPSIARLYQLSIKASLSFSLPRSAKQTPALSVLQCSLQVSAVWEYHPWCFGKHLALSLNGPVKRASPLCCSMTQWQKHVWHICLPPVLCFVLSLYSSRSVLPENIFTNWSSNDCMHAHTNEWRVVVMILVTYRCAGLSFSQIFHLWIHYFNAHVIYKSSLPPLA